MKTYPDLEQMKEIILLTKELIYQEHLTYITLNKEELNRVAKEIRKRMI
jgi:hypothetical protein